MSDLKLVPTDQPTSFEQRLLDAVATEAPSAEQRARVRLALGLPAVAPAPTSATPLVRRGWLLKAGGGLVVASATVLALLYGMGRQSNVAEPAVTPLVVQPAPAPPPSLAPGAGVGAPPSAASASSAREAANTPTQVDAPSASNAPPAAPTKRLSKPAPGESAGDLSEQLRLIDAARSAVAQGNATAASAALDSYRTRFPRGPFGQEAAVLQIETLDLQGNHAAAAARARSFLTRYPNSPHASVVRRIAGS